MATPSSSSAPDKSTIEKTVKFFNQNIVLQKFTLRAIIKARKRFERDVEEKREMFRSKEKETRCVIGGLMGRMRKEQEMHPGVFES